MRKLTRIIIMSIIVLGLCLALCGCEMPFGRSNTGGNDASLCMHEYEERTVAEATCTEDGVLEYTCRKCGDSYQETVPALGHDMQLFEAVQSVCTEESKRVYKCTRCDHTEIETQPPAYEAHDYAATIVTDPTCTKAGSIQYTCTRCGSSFTESLSRTEHKWEQMSANSLKCKDCGLECSYPPELGFDGVVALYETMRAELIQQTPAEQLATANTHIGRMYVEYSTYTNGSTDEQKGLMIFVRAEYMKADEPQLIERERIHPFRCTLSDGKWQIVNRELIELKADDKSGDPSTDPGSETPSNSAGNGNSSENASANSAENAAANTN